MMRKAAVYVGLLAMTVGMASVQAPEGRAQEGIDRQMVYVPAGNISQMPMGLRNQRTNVSMPDFWIGKTEVTGALWQEVYDWAVKRGYRFMNKGNRLGTMWPVTDVDWYDIVVWKNACSYKGELVPVYRDTIGNVLKDAAQAKNKKVVQSNNNGCRLPSEDEWEMAAKWLGMTAPTIGSLAKERIATTGKDGKTYYWTPGNYASGATENVNNAAETGAVAWYLANPRDHRGATAQKVAGKRANVLGMYDVSGNVSGNVSEWQFTSGGYGRVIKGGTGVVTAVASP